MYSGQDVFGMVIFTTPLVLFLAIPFARIIGRDIEKRDKKDTEQTTN